MTIFLIAIRSFVILRSARRARLEGRWAPMPALSPGVFRTSPKVPAIDGMRLVAFLATLLLAGTAAAQNCKTDPRLVASCFVVHGRITVHANMRPYLWPLGTHRLIGIASPDGAVLWPSELAKVFADPRNFDKAAYGDFEICPFTRRRPGIMQMACVAGLRHLDVRPRGD
jgi:hypothetical protein